ncbi:OmpA family protein [Kamptonema cortianum]|nr:OmpA family protein [Oscillatoria laete-virens]MDK3160303.1 OmpA family protein [Kamptonema cortianum]MDL5053684.1 OmpA family protein [Oscillatoria laete-virens NRMC-F 0139]
MDFHKIRVPLFGAVFLGAFALFTGILAIYLLGGRAAYHEQMSKMKEDIRILTAEVDKRKSEVESVQHEVVRKNAELEAKNAELTMLTQNLTDTKTKMQQIAQEKERLQKASGGLRDDLRNQIDSQDVMVSEAGDQLVIKITDRIPVESGRQGLGPKAKEILDKIALALKRFPDRAARIEGHTDDIPLRPGGRFASNWELSASRAAEAVRYLEEQGIPGNRLQAMGLADTRPIVPNNSDANRAINRRLEIVLIPFKEPSPATPDKK